MDFDWEVPNTLQMYQDYSALLIDAAKILQDNGILISVAVHPKQIFPNTCQIVDRINLMTYDMVTQRNQHHAELKNVEEAAGFLLRAGCPASKIVVGIPAYARHGDNPGDVKTFSEIVDGVLEMEPTIDEASVVTTQEWKGFLFDSPSLVAEKVRFVCQKAFGGIFFWELGQDKQHEKWSPGGILLEAAGKEFESLKVSGSEL